jgi:hypothetical protein
MPESISPYFTSLFRLKIYHPVGMIELVLQMNLGSCCPKKVLFWPFSEKMEILDGLAGILTRSMAGGGHCGVSVLRV